MRRTPGEFARLEQEVMAVGELRVSAMRYLDAHRIPQDVAFEAVRGELTSELLEVLDRWIEDSYPDDVLLEQRLEKAEEGEL